jgi:hypothetical protein
MPIRAAARQSRSCASLKCVESVDQKSGFVRLPDRNPVTGHLLCFGQILVCRRILNRVGLDESSVSTSRSTQSPTFSGSLEHILGNLIDVEYHDLHRSAAFIGIPNCDSNRVTAVDIVTRSLQWRQAKSQEDDDQDVCRRPSDGALVSRKRGGVRDHRRSIQCCHARC